MNNIHRLRFTAPGLLVTAFILASLSNPLVAEDLKVTLSGAAEVPPVSTMASGDALISIKNDMRVSGKVITSGLAATMAHIHLGKAGVNGPVLIGLTRQGDNDWVVPEGSMLNASSYQAYQDGELYINVHSNDHKAGEIRGQLNPPRSSVYGY